MLFSSLLLNSLVTTLSDGENIANWVGIIIASLTSGSVGWVASVKYSRQQAKADAMKSVQDVYQELLEDIRSDREELRIENGTLRESIRQLEGKIVQMQNSMDQLTQRCSENEKKLLASDKKLAAMQPFICTVPNCPKRCDKH